MSEPSKEQDVPADDSQSTTRDTNKRKYSDGVSSVSETRRPGRARKRRFQKRTPEEILAMRLEVTRIHQADKNRAPDPDPDPVTLDRAEIERQLQSGVSILVLESTETWQSHCRARFCIPSELGGRPNIKSPYRLNLKDVNGRGTWYKPANYFYHVSCVEQILDLSALLASKQLRHNWGMKLRNGLFGVVTCYHSVDMAIEDWFENGGASYDPDVYKDHKEAYNMWKILTQIRASHHVRHIQNGEIECPCGPEPERPIYSTNERTPRLLSELLASIEEMEQIDDIPKEWLEFLAQPEYDEENEKDSKDVAKAQEDAKPRKATDLEMEERRKELVEYIRDLRAEIEKSRMEGRNQEEPEKDEADPKDQSAAKTAVLEKDLAERVTGDIADESGKELPKTAHDFQNLGN